MTVTEEEQDQDRLDDVYGKIRETTVGKSIFRSPRRVTPPRDVDLPGARRNAGEPPQLTPVLDPGHQSPYD